MNHIYKTSDLAKAFDVHTNTIRLYEKWRLISKPERTKSNYRIYTDVHYLQISICRCIFGHPFTTHRIRQYSRKLISAAYDWNIPLCQECCENYLNVIDEEIQLANETAQILKNWVDQNTQHLNPFVNPTKETQVALTYSRKDAAKILHTTSETIRNWERNNLIHPCGTGSKNETLFQEAELERMHVIYMLLQAGYSLFAIQQSLSKYDHGEKEQVIDTLKESCSEEDIMLVGDRWVQSLENVKLASTPLPSLIEKMKEINVTPKS
ncbi:MAG: MerR family transcriptional regulator [Clostridiales bacterium]|nr:MerR family transcriptional regulator [Clostridiales bacterium]